jgi:hypothetical protein
MPITLGIKRESYVFKIRFYLFEDKAYVCIINGMYGNLTNVFRI